MLQILTVGGHKFSTDSKYSINIDRVHSDHQLVIKSVSDGDLGNYECQVNTVPVKTRVVSLVTSSSGARSPVTSDQTMVTTPPPDSPPELGGSITSITGAPDIYFLPGASGTEYKIKICHVVCCVQSYKIENGTFFKLF